MARFLVYTYPGTGHLYPVMDSLAELRRRGHDVSVRTLASQVELLRDLGFSAAALDPALESVEVDEWRARTPIGLVRRIVRIRAEQAGHAIDDLRRAIAEEKPDALIVDLHAFGGAFAAEASGLPWALYEVSLPQLRSPDAPPYGGGLAPRNDVIGKLRDGAIRRVESLTIERMARRQLNPLRAQLGLAPHRNASEHALAAELLVCFTAEPFEYPRSDWPASVRLVGPGTWDPPGETPEWLDSVERPLVLVSASTDFTRDAQLIETGLEGLAQEDVYVVATTGAIDPSRFTAPANARVERFIPHGPIVARAACVVCHGGVGIVQKALAAGVPVCAVPFGRDHVEAARRVEVCGAGTRLPGRRLNPDRLLAAVREASSKREGAQKIATAFADAGGPKAAADAFEALLPG